MMQGTNRKQIFHSNKKTIQNTSIFKAVVQFVKWECFFSGTSCNYNLPDGIITVTEQINLYDKTVPWKFTFKHVRLTAWAIRNWDTIFLIIPVFLHH